MASKEDQLVNTRKGVGLLIEDGAPWFEKLLENSKDLLVSPLDEFSLVLHGLMLELGFSSTVSRSQPPPQPWKSAVGHSVRYSYPPHEIVESVVLTVMSLGPLTKILGTDTESKVSFSTAKLRPVDHTKIAHLARLFKTEVGGPLLNSTRARLGLPVSGLLGLPPEILLRILAKTDARSMIRLGKVSKQLRVVSRDQTLWKRLYLKDFGKRNFVIKEFNRTLEHKGEPEDWIDLYKEEYQAKIENPIIKIERENRISENMPVPGYSVPRPPLFPFPDPDSSIPDPLRPDVPGIIGGDYDRIPLFGGHTLRPTNFLPPRPRFDPPGPHFGRGGRGGAFGGGGGFGGGGWL